MCGVIGVIGVKNAPEIVYSGLLTLQHRGQDAAGILAYDQDQHRFSIHKSNGLISDVFKNGELSNLKGSMSIGHTRYQTMGVDSTGIQPLYMSYPYGIGLVHNGNTVNYEGLKTSLNQESHRLITTSNDLEVILHLLAEKLSNHSNEFSFNSLATAVEYVFNRVQGSYSVVGMIAGVGMFAFKDPLGFRPLVFGKDKDSYSFASETNALNFIGHEYVKDVDAGELVFISLNGEVKTYKSEKTRKKPCMFEWIYFANTESKIEDVGVYQVRLKLGQFLAEKIDRLMKEKKIFPDIVAPVPDTARPCAISLAEKLNLPYREVLVKNRYIQRSFILENQKKREKAVELKLFPIESEIRDKSIVLVDDSIVRGTTSKKIVNLLKRYGAKEVIVASTCPQITHPCFFGIDFPSEDELIASGKNSSEIAESIGANFVVYNEIQDVKEAIGLTDLCFSCLDGEYPYEKTVTDQFVKQRKEERIEL